MHLELDACGPIPLCFLMSLSWPLPLQAGDPHAPSPLLPNPRLRSMSRGCWFSTRPLGPLFVLQLVQSFRPALTMGSPEVPCGHGLPAAPPYRL